jgi:hypothetical protein
MAVDPYVAAAQKAVLPDIFLDEFKALVRTEIAAGRIKRTVESDLEDIIRPRLVVSGDHAVDRETGIADPALLLETLLNTSKPHWKVTEVSADAEENAFGIGSTLKGRAALREEIGPVDYAERMASWGCSPASLKPGTRPPNAGEKAAVKGPEAGEKNPWSSHPANLDPKTGRYNAAAMGRQSAIARSLGLEKAAQLAKAAGGFLGATRPGGKDADFTRRLKQGDTDDRFNRANRGGDHNGVIRRLVVAHHRIIILRRMIMGHDARVTEHLKNLGNNVARRGSVPKRCGTPAKIHNGMTRMQHATAGRGGMPHSTAGIPDASSSNPMDPEPVGKKLTPVVTTRGMRSRITPHMDDLARRDRGAKIMSEAVENCRLPKQRS